MTRQHLVTVSHCMCARASAPDMSDGHAWLSGMLICQCNTADLAPHVLASFRPGFEAHVRNRLSVLLPAGAAILCCGKLAASELHCLTAAPRLAIHEALAAPHKYLGTPYELGLSSRMDDACIAYQLFLEVTPAISV